MTASGPALRSAIVHDASFTRTRDAQAALAEHLRERLVEAAARRTGRVARTTRRARQASAA